MTPRFLLITALTLIALPTFAQPSAKPLTPPEVLGKAKTIQFTATEVLGGVPQEISTAMLSLPNKAYVVDTDAKTKAVDVVYASDGKTQTEYRASRGHYTTSDAPARIGEIESRTVALSVLTDFFDAAAFAKFQQSKNDPANVYRRVLAKQEGKTIAEVLTVDPAPPRSSLVRASDRHGQRNRLT